MRSPLFSMMVLVGCGSSASVDGGAVRPDTGYCAYEGFPEVDEATPSPDGTGWCCPVRSPSCDCTSTGGWVANPCECAERTVCDAAPPEWTPQTDAHGCEGYSVSDSEEHCCNCVEPDAGAP